MRRVRMVVDIEVDPVRREIWMDMVSLTEKDGPELFDGARPPRVSLKGWIPEATQEMVLTWAAEPTEIVQ